MGFFKEPDPAEVLFEVERKAKLLKGQAVTVQTMWGEESGTVVDVGPGPGGWPMAMILMELGDTISIDVARVKTREKL